MKSFSLLVALILFWQQELIITDWFLFCLFFLIKAALQHCWVTAVVVVGAAVGIARCWSDHYSRCQPPRHPYIPSSSSKTSDSAARESRRLRSAAKKAAQQLQCNLASRAVFLQCSCLLRSASYAGNPARIGREWPRMSSSCFSPTVELFTSTAFGL